MTIEGVFTHSATTVQRSLFQNRGIAGVTLVISTLVGGFLGALSQDICNGYLSVLHTKNEDERMRNLGSNDTSVRRMNKWYEYPYKIVPMIPGVMIVAGLNVTLSKCLNLPFSRVSSVAMTLATLFAAERLTRKHTPLNF